MTLEKLAERVQCLENRVIALEAKKDDPVVISLDDNDDLLEKRFKLPIILLMTSRMRTI